MYNVELELCVEQMIQAPRLLPNGKRPVSYIYAVVFNSRFSVLLVFILLGSFLLQPIHQAYANEAAAEQQVEEVAPQLPAEVEEQLPDAGDQTSDEPEVLSDSAPSSDTNAENSDGTDIVIDEATGEAEEQVSTNDTTDDVAESDTAEPANVAKSTTTDTSTQDPIDTGTTPTSTNTETEIVDDQASSTDAEQTDTNDQGSTSGGSSGGSSNTGGTTNTASTSTASSTETTTDSASTSTVTTTASSTDDGTSEEDQASDEILPDTTEDPSEPDDLIDADTIEDGVTGLVDNVVNEVVNLTRQLVTEENYYQFSKQSCVAVGDGTYHCTSKEQTALDPDSAVYAEQDADGDMEIYLRTSKGDIKQLTDNDFDDTSPDVDLATMRVVWQRIIDGRYQIISYDLETREETQLTFSRNNSMEPKVSKEGIVWQAWDGTDWEIMYFDGKFTDQITQNDGIQDVTPVIEDGYILWSVLGGEKSEARVYSLESGERMTISGHEGGTVANPRFVLVYDTKFENGDVVTVGFDPVTGLAQPVSAKPAELPFDIPEPDPVGEIRALIQNKSTQKDKDVVTVPVADNDVDLDLASSTATSSGALVIDTQPDLDPDLASTTLPEIPEFELTEYDLVITKNASSTNSILNTGYELGTTSIKISTSTQE